MELDIVMLNVLKCPLFLVKLTLITGETMELAVLSSIYGKPIKKLMSLLVTHAKFQATIDVKDLLVDLIVKDIMESVIKMDVELIPIGMEIRSFSGLGQVLTWIPVNLFPL